MLLETRTWRRWRHPWKHFIRGGLTTSESSLEVKVHAFDPFYNLSWMKRFEEGRKDSVHSMRVVLLPWSFTYPMGLYDGLGQLPWQTYLVGKAAWLYIVHTGYIFRVVAWKGNIGTTWAGRHYFFGVSDGFSIIKQASRHQVITIRACSALADVLSFDIWVHIIKKKCGKYWNNVPLLNEIYKYIYKSKCISIRNANVRHILWHADLAENLCTPVHFFRGKLNVRYSHHRRIRRPSRDMAYIQSRIRGEDVSMTNTKTGILTPFSMFLFCRFYTCCSCGANHGHSLLLQLFFFCGQFLAKTNNRLTHSVCGIHERGWRTTYYKISGIEPFKRLFCRIKARANFSSKKIIKTPR